jgi:hypothetical protein
MKRKFYLLFVFSMLSLTGLFAQNKVVVAPGDDLIAAIAGASAGDTIVLQAGMHVARYTNMIIDKSIAIVAETSEKPLVYGGQFDVLGEDIDIYIEGIEYSGATVDSVTGTENLDDLEGDYFLNLHSDLVSCGDITVKDCIIRNLSRSVVRGDRATYTVENFLFDNLIVTDLRGGGDYGPFRLKSKILFSTFTLTNSTFYNFLNKLIDNEETVSHSMEFLVRNCTFYGWGGGKNGQYLFDIKTNDQARLIIQDCILGKTHDDPLADPPMTVNGWRFPEGGIAYAEMLTSVMTPDFVLTNGTYADIEWDVAEYNEEDVDPDFANPEAGDFTLPEGSPLLTASQTGDIIGDPRWDPDYGVGIEKNVRDIVYRLYPNPADNVFHIEMDPAVAGSDVSVYNSIGARVKHFTSVYSETPLNIDGLLPGLYFVRVGTGQADALKLMVK